jgi:uncharacterized membrane protein YeaQ/YmgE (transglycosylase-associated protein family)
MPAITDYYEFDCIYYYWCHCLLSVHRSIRALVPFLAGKIMKGGGFGFVLNLILGVVGGIVGGWVFSLFGIHSDGGFIGSLVTAVVGSVIVLWIASILKK